ncbi:hypothetical protein HPP92_003067 [Vanilla planifolia]|uniref:Uncharacterized protein n=1 Tax=Vanilla planifolia TaxID=51239 RepID=A0A835S1I9_VANPL|nr:hypothetical protein HPP92_003067 [Vanilla planifolia]
MVPLFRQISRCLNSLHFQVAERSLFLWNNDHVRNLITQNRKVVLPIIFLAVERNLRGHWKPGRTRLTLNVRKLFSDADQALFNECLLRFQENEPKERELQAKRPTGSAWRTRRLQGRRHHKASFSAYPRPPKWPPPVP